jgi:hypothetical protein
LDLAFIGFAVVSLRLREEMDDGSGMKSGRGEQPSPPQPYGPNQSTAKLCSVAHVGSEDRLSSSVCARGYAGLEIGYHGNLM